MFYVYPAVYAGQYNQPWIGPEVDSFSDYVAGITHNPDNVVIQGVVQNNMRPVILMQGAASNNTLAQAPLYFDQSNGVVWDSINVTAGGIVSAGKAGVYELGASNLTLSNMRINGFERTEFTGKVRHVDASADEVSRQVALIVDFAPGTAPRATSTLKKLSIRARRAPEKPATSATTVSMLIGGACSLLLVTRDFSGSPRSASALRATGRGRFRR